MEGNRVANFEGKFGQHAAYRLQEERIIWLTTTSRDGTPQPRPVWFFWDGETFLIYSRPNTAKIAHIRRSDRVALNLDGDGHGGDIVVLTGRAEIDREAKPADQVPDYVRKYSEGFKRINKSPNEFGREYSVAVRIYPDQLRGH